MNYHFNGEIALVGLDKNQSFSSCIEKSFQKIYNQKINMVDFEETTFANGEVKVVIKDNIRDKDVYIVHLFDEPNSKKSINDNLMTLVTGINACYYSDAGRITVVIPQYPYSRQDKKHGREGITAKLIGQLIESAGANKIITLDIHSDAIQGFFNKLKMENLYARNYIVEYMNTIKMNNLIVVSPDVGSAKRANFYAKSMNVDLAIISKVRDYSKPSSISKMTLVGSVKDRDVFLYDDMIATGGTLLKACSLLKEKGAKNIYIACSLPYFSDKAYHKFDDHYQQGYFKKVIATNVVNWRGIIENKEWYEPIDISSLFAKVIYSLNEGLSVSGLLS